MLPKLRMTDSHPCTQLHTFARYAAVRVEIHVPSARLSRQSGGTVVFVLPISEHVISWAFDAPVRMTSPICGVS